MLARISTCIESFYCVYIAVTSNIAQLNLKKNTQGIFPGEKEKNYDVGGIHALTLLTLRVDCCVMKNPARRKCEMKRGQALWKFDPKVGRG
jgi:hypothetical protein